MDDHGSQTCVCRTTPCVWARLRRARVFDRNAEPLGDLARVWNAPGRQQGPHVAIVDRGLDVGSHAASSHAAAAAGGALIAAISSAVVRISWA
jgi:hypothetical protein